MIKELPPLVPMDSGPLDAGSAAAIAIEYLRNLINELLDVLDIIWQTLLI